MLWAICQPCFESFRPFNVTVTHRRVQGLNKDLNAIVSIIQKCKKCSSMLTCIKRSEFESRELRQFALCC